MELESYRYDLKTSAKTGKEAYVKENDHNIDATRYLLENWKIKINALLYNLDKYAILQIEGMLQSSL